MEYSFTEIESKWRSRWIEQNAYRVVEDDTLPKYYVLDMFPYPSGAGLHVGHPLGYIASDIFARYKRMKGFNVLHPMGYDAFGLPAEQYAIQTGQHPAVTTEKNIARYREQLDRIGFSFDWSREVKTCDPRYYKWTQWAFVQMFHHWYNKDTHKAEPISGLAERFAREGNEKVNAAHSCARIFSAEAWNRMPEQEQLTLLLDYRLAYLADTQVNWCPALGTVLANDEVKEGFSVRGGHEVIQKEMKQWSLRISAYAQRLLDGLNTVEWTDSLKEIQRNWIGRSQGAEVLFPVKGLSEQMLIFTTRADTIFGVTFMVLAPESSWVDKVTTPAQQEAVANYLELVKKRNERERQADTKSVTGVFTGGYAVNPFTGEEVPIWVSDYVLAGYGTGAIMAVPAHDARDYAFARHFSLPIVPLIEGCDISAESFDAKEGIMMNSGFLNGKTVAEAIPMAIDEVERRGLGTRKINYRLRDAIFSRQRYWGEPFPIYYKNGLPFTVDEKDLPIVLPEVDAYLPTEEGAPPLGRAKEWSYNGYPLEQSTMPGFAGSSAYYLHYMDPNNQQLLINPEKNHYWRNVDLYIGGTEHATGHLLYSRFWTKFLYDIGVVCEDEPYKKLVNQGMIQGRSNFVYRIKGTKTYVSHGLKESYDVTDIHVDVNIVQNDILNLELFRAWSPENADAEFILEEGKYVCGWAIEKMSKSMYNVVNPDLVVERYGADTLRMYEMFLGPLEQSKPWDTAGIEGVHRFLRRFWNLFFDRDGNSLLTNEEPSDKELRTLHKTIKKIGSDIESFSFNTAVSAFMICLNELQDEKCHKRAVLDPLVRLLAPFAPHLAEELYEALGYPEGVLKAHFPEAIDSYLVETQFSYPVSFNGKTRFMLELPLNMAIPDMELAVLNHELSAKWLDGKKPKKIIIVPKRIINVVV
ncbi:MAG: leucine--tRNA ligase [Bacteroidales bacterium]